MKRLILTALLPFFLCSGIGVEQAMNEITKSLVEGKRIRAHYAIAWSEGGTSVLLSGDAVAEGHGFKVAGNGTEIYCDGTSLWVVDPAAKEVYIESSRTLAEFISSKITSVKDLTLSEVRTSAPKSDSTEFVFGTENLDGEWIVTDLRKQ